MRRSLLWLHVWLNNITAYYLLFTTVLLTNSTESHTHSLSLSLPFSLCLSPCFYIQSEFHHGPPQKRQLLARREKILHPAPPTPRRQRELVDFLQTPIQGCVLGSGPLRSETMLREAIDEDWVDARAFNRPAVSRRDCLVSFFFPRPALRKWIAN